MCWWKAHAVTVESCNKKITIKVAAGDNYRQQAEEKDVQGSGRTAVPSSDSSPLYCAAAKAGSCNGAWWCYLLPWDFFRLAVLTSLLDHYWFPPLLEEPRHLVRAKLGQKAEDPGQPLVATQQWCRRPASKTSGSKAWYCRDLQVCLRRRFEVAKGGLKVLIPGLHCSLLQSRYSPAELCGSIQAGSGSDSQGAADIARRALAYEGRQGSLPWLSPHLQGTEFVLGVL